MTGSATEAAESARDAVDWRSVESTALSPILAAALAAFDESGFHGASVREIARRVGVTVPALYYHHDNKEGLLLALLELTIDELRVRTRAADEAGEGDPAQRFANVIFTIVLQMTNHARGAGLDAEARYLGEANWARYRNGRNDIESVVLTIVRDGRRTGEFDVDDPAEITRAILGMCQAIPRWYQSEGKLSPEAVARRYVGIALRMVGADRTPVMPRVSSRRAR